MLRHHLSDLPGKDCGGLTSQEFHFGDFTLDQSSYRLQRGERVLRLEKLPMELLILLIERRGELVSREEIVERLWGKDVFVDVDNGINTAIRKVRAVLRDDPEKPRFVETVVGKGYRFAAPVVSGNGHSNRQAPTLPSIPQAASVPHVLDKEERVVSVRVRVLLGVVGMLVLFTVARILIRRAGANGTNQPAIRSLAVLPLKNLSGDPSQEYLADGITEELIGRLSMIRGLRVTSRTSVMAFKDPHISMPEIAKTLGVDALVEGSVIRDGSRVRVHAQLIRGTTDEHFWSETYDRELGDVLALESEVTQSIAQRVEVTVTGEERSLLVAARHVVPEVYESYLKGEFQLQRSNDKTEIEQSISYFEQAIKRDPTFAPPYIGLAEAYDSLGTIFVGASPDMMRPKVISAARKALELDPQSAEAHVLLAATEQVQWHWREAELEYRRALALKPNDVAAHSGFAIWLLCQGRLEEALAWANRARELDPLGVTGTEIGWILFQAHRYDEAIQEFRSVLAVHPNEASAHWFLGFALIGKDRPEEAILELEKTAAMMHRSPGSIELLATANARAGHRTEALRLINELKRRRKSDFIPAGAFINPYLALRDYDEAFVWFERAYQEQSNILQFLKVHPFFDPVRQDPRFKDLIRRVELD